MFNLGPMELLVVVVVALLVLGPQRLPDAMRQVGKGMAEVRRWSTSVTSTVHSAFDETPAAGAAHDPAGPPAEAAAPAPPAPRVAAEARP